MPDDTEPYWVPPGMDLKHWPFELCAQVAAIINPSIVACAVGQARINTIYRDYHRPFVVVGNARPNRAFSVKTPEESGTESFE